MLSILATSLLLAPALAVTPPPISTSLGFHLLLIPLDTTLPISALSAIHTGAGQSLVVASAAVPQQQHIVLYQNSTAPSSSIARDVLPQGFPMTLLFSPAEGPQDPGDDDNQQPADPDLQSISLTVSGSTPLSIADPDAPPALTHTDPPPGAFYVCDTWVPYYRATYPVFSWSSDGGLADGGDRCSEVRVAPVCEVLEELPPDALGSHDFVEEVRCFVDDGAAAEMYGRGGG